MQRLLVAIGLIACTASFAAVPTEFAVSKDNPAMFLAATPLHKGDVLLVHSLHARLGEELAIAQRADARTPMRVVLRVKLSPGGGIGASGVNEKVTLPVDGEYFFWVLAPNPGTFSNSGNSNVGDANANLTMMHNAFSTAGLDAGAAKVVALNRADIDGDQIKGHYDEGLLVTLSRVSAAGQ